MQKLIATTITFVILVSACSSSQPPTEALAVPTLTRTVTLIPTTTPTHTPTATSAIDILPSSTSTLICVAPTTTTEGWDCLNQSYGFSVHFPPTAEIAGPAGDTLIVWLENSPSNSRIERMLSIALGQTAESCISSDSETIRIGEQKFIVDHGFEPSGVVYEWRSYAVTKGSKSVCFLFTVGFQTWEQGDPFFPPEKDQGLSEVEEILATFRWLNQQ